MKVVRKTEKGVEYLFGLLKEKVQVSTRAVFWKILHNSGQEEISLKIGRYKKTAFNLEILDCDNPKSELTLDNEEFLSLVNFLAENYEPFKSGVKKYIPIGENFNKNNLEHLKAIFNNPDQTKVIDFVVANKVLPKHLLISLQVKSRLSAIEEFENILAQDTTENEWQKWFEDNSWVLGTEFVRVLEERNIDTKNISDYLMQAYDGFLDIVEIKRPERTLKFWSDTKDHDNYIPSSDLIKAITQASKYIYEVEREADSIKFLERVNNTKVIKPRCVLIFGRSDGWDEEQKETYRILNSNYHNLTILTYDHVLERAKRIIDLKNLSKN